MATWKKLIVSGSVAELASVSASVGVLVGTNQQIQPTQADTRLTGSFTGSFAGDGSNLIGVTATPTFPTTVLTDITDSVNTKFFINDDSGNATSGNKQISWSNLLTDIAGGGLVVDSSDSIAVNSGSLQTFFTSASYAGVSGDILINASTGVATIQANSVALGTDTTGNYVATVSGSGALVSSATTGEGSTPEITLNTSSTTFTSGVVSALPAGTVSGSSFSSPSQGTVRAVINGVQTDVDTGLQTGDSPQFVDVTLTGDITVGGNDVKMSGGTTALTFSGTGDVAVAGDLKVGGNDIKASDNTTAITLNGANVTIAGDLVVNGTTTNVNTTTLTVEDQWALFASGSDGNTDGGIVVQQGATTGYALGIDASADRWALQNNLDGTQNTPTSITPDAFMGVIQEGTSNPASTPVYGGASGFGTIFVDSNTGNIWIYS
jgi:hypothetical protein